MSGDATNCPNCGLPFADDNDTTHECPPGFRALKELRDWPRCNDGTYLKIPRPSKV